MSGVASDTGSISPTMVAKIVIDNIIVTPETKPFNQSHNTRENTCDTCTCVVPWQACIKIMMIASWQNRVASSSSSSSSGMNVVVESE